MVVRATLPLTIPSAIARADQYQGSVRATLPYQILSVSLNLKISRKRSGRTIAHSSSLAARSSGRCSYITKVESSAQRRWVPQPKRYRYRRGWYSQTARRGWVVREPVASLEWEEGGLFQELLKNSPTWPKQHSGWVGRSISWDIKDSDTSIYCRELIY